MTTLDDKRPIPFAVDRAFETTLTQQVLQGLREAIECGYYPVGSVLPTTRGLAKALGVGRVIAERAISGLKAEGLVDSRPKVGSVVLPAETKRWKGHVLLVVTDHAGSYYSNLFADEVKTRLANAGYMCTQVVADSFLPGGVNLNVLKAVLRRSVDFALVLFSSPMVEKCISECGIDFAVVGAKPCRRRHCVGRIDLRWNAVMPEFAANCRERGIGRVLQVRTRKVATADARPELVRVGIACEEMLVREPKDAVRPYGTAHLAFKKFGSWILRNRERLPDLVLFTDDGPTVGALWAMSEAGLNAPEDVRIVSWANRGNDLVYRRKMTQMTMDPRRHGQVSADFILTYLKEGVALRGLSIGPIYEPGETFD